MRAFGYLDLDGAAEQPDILKEMGFVGLKPYKPHFPYSDERYFPIYERAQALRMPVLFHTGLVAKGPAMGDRKEQALFWSDKYAAAKFGGDSRSLSGS